MISMFGIVFHCSIFNFVLCCLTFFCGIYSISWPCAFFKKLNNNYKSIQYKLYVLTGKVNLQPKMPCTPAAIVRIQVGHYAAVQAVDYNGDGLVDVLAGNQERSDELFRCDQLLEKLGRELPFLKGRCCCMLLFGT